MYTVGEADNAISLSSSIVDSKASSVATKAGSEDAHANHIALASGTELALQISGTWTDHSPELVVKPTTATVGTAASGHNPLTLSPNIFWDDFGTADPANASTGRDEGLTIYGAAVNGDSNAPAVSDFSELPWTLSQDQRSDWSAKDLLTSHNVKVGGLDGTYKFDSRSEGKLLEFRHQMSKITVRLIADEGFQTTGGVGASAHRFASVPEVKLTSNDASSSNAEWPFLKGNVDVTTGIVTGQSTPSTVIMRTDNTSDATYTVIKDALVVPGSCFGESDTDIIARVNADGNIFYITAEKIRAKMYELNASTDYKTEPGKNYVITVRVKKTKIEVTATVLDWESVYSEVVTPLINITANFGDNSGVAATGSFSFYRSTSLDSGYSDGFSGNQNSYFAAESSVVAPDWTFSNPLYWPSHDTHYQMRGVWPSTGVEEGDVTYPRVKAKTHDSKEYQVIEVNNVKYAQGSFPSDLMIARPNVAEDATCHNGDHTAKNLFSEGVCATEGTVNLEFAYMMSKVQVNLSTTDGTDKVRLEGAVVEVTNIYTTGDIKLGDRGAFTTGSASTYALNVLDGTGNENTRLDAVVPQVLTYSTPRADSNVRFKITITNEDNTKDIYYTDVAPIKKSGSTDLVAPSGKWESGMHYVYNLKLSKTQIDVVATIKDWTTVDASDEVWF